MIHVVVSSSSRHDRQAHLIIELLRNNEIFDTFENHNFQNYVFNKKLSEEHTKNVVKQKHRLEVCLDQQLKTVTHGEVIVFLLVCDVTAFFIELFF